MLENTQTQQPALGEGEIRGASLAISELQVKQFKLSQEGGRKKVKVLAVHTRTDKTRTH